MRHAAALALATLATLPAPTRADVRLPGIIGDHMVLQQERPIRIWGWADAGETVAVTIAPDRASAVADAEGQWRVTLPSRKAGGPIEVVVEGRDRRVLKDVLVGEVWLASGQSNMQFATSSTTHATEDVASAAYPQIRLFTVRKESSLTPLADTPGGWTACSPDTVGPFSAVAYFFGRRLHEELGVPIGLVAASWGGTTAEEWTSRPFLEGRSELAPILKRWDESGPAMAALFREPQPFELWLDDLQLFSAAGNREPVRLEDFEDGDLRNGLGGEWKPAGSAADGRFALEVAASGSGRAARVSGRLKVSDQFQVEVTLDGRGAPVDLTAHEGLSFRVRGRGFVKLHALQPSIVDWDHYVFPTLAAEDEWRTVTIRFDELKQAGWGKRTAFTPGALSGFLLEIVPLDTPVLRPPSGLFNGMIAPVVPFTVRGAAWYQGEGNAGRSYQYRTLLPALIRSWRAAWEEPGLPFLIVQLPNYKPRQAEPSESGWAELREAQLLTWKADPNAGVAVTIDLGEADDVHPRDKREVGVRLARWALGAVYGRNGVYSGPLFARAVTEGDRIRVQFDQAGGGLVAADGQPLRGFAVAGSDRVFHWAEAEARGSEVVVRSPAVKQPLAVRYAWADNPDANLANREGLPASPFRNDDWPGVTIGAR